MNDNNESATTPPEKSAVVSTTEAAKQLGVSVRTIQLWVENGRLVAWKTAGNHRRIFQWSIDQYQQSEGQLLTPELSGKADHQKDRTIMVIEDDRTTQVYYETMLQLMNLEDEVQFAEDGIEGLVLIGRHEPWLIILDIDMPRLNGIEVVKTLEQQNVVEHIALIVISNVPHETAIARGLPEHCDFHAKPISLEDFRLAIANARPTRITQNQLNPETKDTQL